MSNYTGRRAPNVSQYIADLNTIPTPQEMAAQSQSLNMEDDFALFTNAEFFDFDMGDMPEIPQSADYDPVQEDRARRQNASAFRHANSNSNSISKQAEPLTGDFSFPVFNSYPNLVDQSSSTSYPHGHHSGAQYPFTSQSPTTSSPTEAHALPQGVGISHLDGLHDQSGHVVVEETARIAAEEDKRRRNTAASARFRIKKKQREQALERTAKEMTEKVHVLESKVSQLEMENKWLKSLITEKNESKPDLSELYKKFADKKIDVERSTGERNDGVGTDGEKETKSTAKA